MLAPVASLKVFLVVACAAVCDSADPAKAHAHSGVLEKYARLPPSQIGVKMDTSPEALRKGSPVLKLMETPGGWMRSVSVQDVHAPEDVVWSAINDVSALRAFLVPPPRHLHVCLGCC